MLYACRTVAIPDRRCIEMIEIPHSGALPTQLRPQVMVRSAL
jgi:hypothetical protein